MSPVELTDGDLMRRLQSGDADSLGVLFERHQERLTHYFLRLTRDTQVSDDLVQGVFVRVLRLRDTYRDQGQFRVWLYRVARNCWIDHLRATAGDSAVVELTSDVEGDTPSPSERLDKEEQVTLVRRALALLPADRRELLVLSRFEGFTAPQIARLLNCSPGAVRVRIHRALTEIRQHIEALQKEATP